LGVVVLIVVVVGLSEVHQEEIAQLRELLPQLSLSKRRLHLTYDDFPQMPDLELLGLP
jgi:hypothetical protein